MLYIEKNFEQTVILYIIGVLLRVLLQNKIYII